MNVNQIIEGALSDLVNGNIWPLSCPLETPAAEYIVYNPELEKPEIFGDDTDLEWTHYMQIHWYKKGDGKKPANYIEKRKEIRSRLRNAGFTMSDIQEFFEKDTGFTHLCFSCNIEEEMQ
ncbi:MAG: hypothetical protein Q4E91_06115 [Lachnospiraceae bacterium]|nr:hypothetical protein [Lachnospiraceae bacterium]